VIQYEGLNPYRKKLKYYTVIWLAKIYAEEQEKYSKTTTSFGNKFITSSREKEDGL
jgi:hypothetical protein